MKILKKFFSWLCVTAVVMTQGVSVGAIDFDSEKAMQSVFVVHDDEVVGSGFALGENVIITNAHVALNLTEYKLTTYDNKQHSAFLIGFDEERDIAVLGVEDMTLTPLPTADHMKMKPGDDVYAIGSPKGLYFSVSKGIISSKQRDFDGYIYIQSDAATYAGNSGGPLFDSTGNVVGVNTLVASGADGLTFSIPIGDVISFMSKLGLEVDDKGNVVGRVDRSLEIDYKKPEEPDNTSIMEFVEANVMSAEQIALVSVCISAVSILVNVILVLALRRMNERIKLNTLQQKWRNKNGSEIDSEKEDE